MSVDVKPEGMSYVVKTVAGWLKGFIFLFGITVVLYGHETPGGGFAGGIVIACSLILLTLAEGSRVSSLTVSQDQARVTGSLGALLFLAVMVAAVFWGREFVEDFLRGLNESWQTAFRARAIDLYDVAVGIVVSMLVYQVFYMLSSLHVTTKAGHRRMIRRGRE